jgi:hypothetical protein
MIVEKMDLLLTIATPNGVTKSLLSMAMEMVKGDIFWNACRIA